MKRPTNAKAGRKPKWNTRGVAFTGIVSFLRAPICLDIDELDADIAILGAAYDEGTPWFTGSRFAPRAIREMSVRFVSPVDPEKGFYSIDDDRHYLARELREARVADCGDIQIIYTNPIRTFENISDGVRAILAKGAMPIVLGGDHAVTFGVVRGFSERLDVIHFDAHLDYSDFIHGGPIQPNSNPIRLISKMDHVGHIVQVGMRTNPKIRASDLYESRSRGNDVITVTEMRRRGLESVFAHLKPGGPIYVSIDIDVLDMPLVPGCGSSETGGLEVHELQGALSYLAETHAVLGFDLVEVNPLLDVPARNTSYLASQIITQFMSKLVEHPDWQARHGVEPEKTARKSKPKSAGRVV